MHITITGNVGSGKSTVASIIAENGFEKISTGDMQRKMAESMGISTLELLERSKVDNTVDNLLDGMVIKTANERKNDNIIFESRLAWHFVKDSLKVFIKCDVDEAVRRIMSDKRTGEKYASATECKQKIIDRMEAEKQIFQKLYDVNLYDENNYDLVVNSTNLTPSQVAQVILDAIHK